VRAYALSQRGHGDADRPETGYRPQDFASDVAEFLTAVGVQKAVIVGHSMGSLIAQRFAIDHPGRFIEGLEGSAQRHRSQLSPHRSFVTTLRR
jgi:pimeloyl-ACP methyl ester carboxylesterase